MAINQTIARRVKRRAAERGETAKELFSRCGMSPTTGARRMSGRSAWTTDELDLLARELRIPVTDLFASEERAA